MISSSERWGLRCPCRLIAYLNCCRDMLKIGIVLQTSGRVSVSASIIYIYIFDRLSASMNFDAKR